MSAVDDEGFGLLVALTCEVATGSGCSKADVVDVLGWTVVETSQATKQLREDGELEADSFGDENALEEEDNSSI